MMADGVDEASGWRHRRFLGFRRLRLRLVASVAALTGWVSATLLFLGFWATKFTLFQDIVVFVVSLVILFGVLAASWISFGMAFLDFSE